MVNLKWTRLATLEVACSGPKLIFRLGVDRSEASIELAPRRNREITSPAAEAIQNPASAPRWMLAMYTRTDELGVSVPTGMRSVILEAIAQRIDVLPIQDPLNIPSFSGTIPHSDRTCLTHNACCWPVLGTGYVVRVSLILMYRPTKFSDRRAVTVRLLFP